MKSVIFLVMLCLPALCFATYDCDEEKPQGFSEPPANYRLRHIYSHLDPDNQIREVHLQKALRYYEYNKDRISNDNYLTLIDFSKNAFTKRLFQIDMNTGRVLSMLVAAGRGSDPDNDGDATEFSNEGGTHQSSLGFYLTDSTYDGENGYSLFLHGLSRTNSLACDRAIVMHGADYVTGSRAGRSWGCPAVSNENARPLINRLKGGSLLYIFFD